MALTIEDVQKAAETIGEFCKQFEEDFPKRMETLVGEDTLKLSNDLQVIQSMQSLGRALNNSILQLNFKEWKE